LITLPSPRPALSGRYIHSRPGKWW